MLEVDSTGELLTNFCRCFPEMVKKIKNPFLENPVNDKYCERYLKFVLKANHENSNFRAKFISNCWDKLTP